MKSSEMGFDPKQLNKETGNAEILEKRTEPEIEETIEIIKFNEQATETEKSPLERFRGKSKEVAGVLMLVSTLSFTPGVVKEAYAGQKEGGARAGSVEKEKTQEEKAIDFLGKLHRLPDNPRALNPGHNELLKERAARTLIELYAIQRKGLTSGYVSPEDVRNALEELNGVSSLYADRVLGNNDGKIDAKEMQKLQQAIKGSAGLRALMEMYLQYSEQYTHQL